MILPVALHAIWAKFAGLHGVVGVKRYHAAARSNGVLAEVLVVMPVQFPGNGLGTVNVNQTSFTLAVIPHVGFGITEGEPFSNV